MVRGHALGAELGEDGCEHHYIIEVVITEAVKRHEQHALALMSVYRAGNVCQGEYKQNGNCVWIRVALQPHQ